MISSLHSDLASEMWAYEALGDRDGPQWLYLRAKRAMAYMEQIRRAMGEDAPDDPHLRADVLAYLSHPDVGDRQIASAFMDSWDRDAESDAILLALDDRSLVWNFEALQSDPLNIAYINAIVDRPLRVFIDKEGSSALTMEQRILFDLRRIVAQPFAYHSLQDYPMILDVKPQSGEASLADYIFISALLNTGHGTSSVIQMLELKLRLYDWYDKATRLPTLLQTSDNPEEDLVLMPHEEFLDEILCPIARLSRLYAAACEVANRCTENGLHYGHAFEAALTQIRADGVCLAEMSGPLAAQYYTVDDVDMIDIYAGIENRE